MSDKEKKPVNPSIWVFSTYFAEGLPFGIIRSMSSVFFTDIGMKNQYIGYLNFLGIPWNLKFLWAPLVDLIGSRKYWMVALQGLITLLSGVIAVLCFSIPAQGDASPLLAAIAVTLVALAFLSATNDIAIDGYFIEGLPDKKEQAGFTGYRVMAWRLSFIFVRFGLIAVADLAAKFVAKDNVNHQWGYAFGAGMLTMLLVTVFNLLILPRTKTVQSESRSFASHLGSYVNAFKTWLQQDKIGWVILFIIFYKIGDEMLFSMGTPFLMRALDVTKGQISWLSGLVGTFGSIAGTMLAGWYIKKVGLKKAIWPLTILMNFNIWAYVWLAWYSPSATTHSGLALIAAVHAYEQMAAGLGNAVLIVFILRTCKADFKAAHYAIGSAFMSLPSTVIGGFGGQIVNAIGYLNLFIISFCVSIPAMLVIFKVPLKDDK